MSKEKILEEISEIAQEVFEDDELELTEATVAEDVDNWDSLTHLMFISEIEKNTSLNFLWERFRDLQM